MAAVGPTLTIEALEAVIDQASDDSASLRQLSFLCSTFLPRARYHLFRSICIRTVQQMESSGEFFNSHPWLLPLVKRVTIATALVFEGKSSPNVRLLDVVPVHLLIQFPNLHTWMMMGYGDHLRLSLHRNGLSCYRKYGVGIRNLHLDGVTFENMSDLKGFISAFTSIRHLHCGGVWVPKEEHRSLHLGANMVTQSLKVKGLHCSYPMNVDVVEYLIDSSLATINDLVLTFTQSVVWHYSERLIKVVSQLSQLSSFKLVLRMPIIISPGTPLESLEVDHIVLQDIRGMTQILGHVQRACLKYVQVEFIPDPIAAFGFPLFWDDAADPCKALEDALLAFPLCRLLVQDPLRVRRAGRAELWSPIIQRAFVRLHERKSLILPAHPKEDISDPPGHEAALSHVVVCRHSKLVVSTSWDGTIIIWDLLSGMVLEEWLAHKGPVNSFALSPDGRRLISAGGVIGETFVAWDIREGVHRVAALQGHAKPVSSCDWSFDGTLIVSASEDGTLRIWDGLTFEQRGLLNDPQTTSNPACMLLNGNVHYLAWVSKSSTKGDQCCIWRPSRGEPPKVLLPAPQSSRRSVSINALSSDPQCKRLATAHREQEQEQEYHVVRIWDFETGVVLAVLTGHAEEVRDLRFSPDGASILIASQDGFVKIWDTESGQEATSFEPAGGNVRRACYSPDGRYIATVSLEMVQLWHAGDGSCIAVLAEYKEMWPCGAVSEVTFSPNGEFLVFGGLDGIVHFRRLSDFIGN